MDGRPFRIAAAGLGTALIASIVAGVSHFRTESRLLAQSQAVSIPADSISIALSPAPDALTVPAWKADEAVANTLPDRSGRSHRPGASVASTVRRKKEFVELGRLHFIQLRLEFGQAVLGRNRGQFTGVPVALEFVFQPLVSGRLLELAT